jgi:hypothetical protein
MSAHRHNVSGFHERVSGLSHEARRSAATSARFAVTSADSPPSPGMSSRSLEIRGNLRGRCDRMSAHRHNVSGLREHVSGLSHEAWRSAATPARLAVTSADSPPSPGTLSRSPEIRGNAGGRRRRGGSLRHNAGRLSRRLSGLCGEVRRRHRDVWGSTVMSGGIATDSPRITAAPGAPPRSLGTRTTPLAQAGRDAPRRRRQGSSRKGRRSAWDCSPEEKCCKLST